MTYLEKMKENLITQIKALDASEFEKLIGVLQGDYPVTGCPVDLSKMFSCDECRETYGNCPEEKDDCSKRFIILARILATLVVRGIVQNND